MEDATANPRSGTLSLGKCWQGPEPFLCFQATWSTRTLDGTERVRGYFIVDARRGKNPLQWQTEKPEELVAQGAASSLIRKFAPSCHVTMMYSSDSSPSGEPFAALRLKPSAADDNYGGGFVLAITGRSNPQIDFISGTGLSLFRWNSQGCYTIRKAAEPYLKDVLQASDLGESIQLLMTSLLGSESLPHLNQGRESASTLDPSQRPLPLYQRDARDRVARRLKTLKKTLIQDRKKVPSADAVALQKLKADALRSWIHLVKEDQHELILKAEMVGARLQEPELAIELDPDRTPGENLNQMFQYLQKMERALNLGQRRVQHLEFHVEKMESALVTLRGPKELTTGETAHLLAECGLQSASHAKGAAQPTKGRIEKSAVGRTFMSSDQGMMVLGRTAEENDQLTKSAKSNDWWLHAAAGVHGTHVIVPSKSLVKGELSPATLREAMILAIHFSRLSLSKEGEVYVTRRSALKKRKGAPAGLWQIGRSETMLVRYNDDDLKAIFSREKRHGTIRHNDTIA